MNEQSKAGKSRRSRITLSEALVDELLALRDSTGIGVMPLLRGTRDIAPAGLNSAIVNSWLNGSTKTARQDHLDFVGQRWQEMSETEQPRIQIEEEERQRLAFASKRCGMRIASVCALPGAPADLTPSIINRMLIGALKSMRREHLTFLQTTWNVDAIEQIPDEPDMIPISADSFERLSEFNRLGYLPTAIFSAATSPVPSGLTEGMVANWLRRHCAKAQAPHLGWVFSQCDAMAIHPRRRIAISPDMHRELMALRDRTQLSPKAIMQRLHNPPNGLTAGAIARWSQGTAKTARKDHWDFVIAALKERDQRIGTQR